MLSRTGWNRRLVRRDLSVEAEASWPELRFVMMELHVRAECLGHGCTKHCHRYVIKANVHPLLTPFTESQHLVFKHANTQLDTPVLQCPPLIL